MHPSLAVFDVAPLEEFPEVPETGEPGDLLETSVAEAVEVAAARLRALIASQGVGVIAGVASNYVSIVWEGFLVVDSTDQYTFTVNANDGFSRKSRAVAALLFLWIGLSSL